MKVLMISGDPRILDQSSDAGRRLKEYREVLGEIEVLIANRRLINFGRAYFSGRKILRAKKFDLITAQDTEHAFLAWLLSRKFNIPWQMQIHTDIFSPYFVKSSVLNKLRVLLVKFLIPRASCIRVVSQRVKNSIQASGFKLQASGVTVLPIFVDTQKIRNTPATLDLHEKYGRDKFIILMASRITKEKNIALALGAVSSLIPALPARLAAKRAGRRANKRIVLVIVGDGPEKKNLELQTMDYKLQTFVRFEYSVPFDTLVSYCKTCDLFLLTSNYEGYGRTLVEAATAGAKIVSSDVGIAREILEEENIFPIGDNLVLLEKLKLATKGQLSPPKPLPSQTKEDYLKLYKRSFELCLQNKKFEVDRSIL